MSRVRNLILLVLVVACGFSVWLVSRSGPTTTPRVGRAQPLVAEPGVGQVLPSSHVAVLNGTEVAGLARRFSRLLPAHGCVVTRVDNAPAQDLPTSLLVNRRLPEAQAQALARRLGIQRVLDEWDGRCDEDAVLVLGADHARVLAHLEE